MSRMIDDWDKMARSLGYVNELDMLVDMYITQRLSIKEISSRLGYATHSIQRHLAQYEISTRARGGPNNQSSLKQKLFHLDQRYVHSQLIEDVCDLVDCSRFVVYKYMKMIKGEDNEILHNQPMLGVGEIQQPEQDTSNTTSGG